MRIVFIVVFAIVVIIGIAESIEERVEPAFLGDGFLLGVNATIWQGREDKLIVDEV
jgi:hypothetical protein